MKDVSPMFIPLCGLFGAVAGYFLYDGGAYTFIGMGIGFLMGAVFRIIIRNKKRKD